MTARWPQTVRGWLELVAIVGAILSAIGGGAWAFHESNAYAEDIQLLEADISEGLRGVIDKIQSERCEAWLSEITALEQREASGDLTVSQRDRLIWLRRQYEDKCQGGG